MLRPRKFSGRPLLFDAMLFAAMARGPLSALPRGGGDVRGDFRCLLFSCGFAALGLRKFSQRSLSAMRHSTKLFLITKFAKDRKGSGYFLIVNFVLFGRWSVTNGEINHYYGEQ